MEVVGGAIGRSSTEKFGYDRPPNKPSRSWVGVLSNITLDSHHYLYLNGLSDARRLHDQSNTPLFSPLLGGGWNG